MKGYLYLFLILVACCCSSCFQIVEEINLSDNGTGTVNLTVNLSQSKTKVASILLLDSVNGYKIPSKQKIQKEMDEVVTYLKNSKGITNVSRKLDLENFIASVSFSFNNISNINNISQNVLKKLKVNAISSSSYSFSAANHVFERNYAHHKEALVQYNKLKPEVKNVFKEATYTSIYRFEVPVSVCTNPLAKVSASKKAVMVRTGMLGLINGKTNISNRITLSK
ncbi:hypothetical protein [Pedobacter sp.]|jgi:hypothetical protein|uniref:hypothetical protein n=1 Tax=Pedobacter sp. TaxID=1411316 RepID=UPI002C4687D3|nr:hypothetical protein [Pedobacter sp.]HWW37956.1 hypothetical protein [Pedobacter sp.]